MESSIVVKVKYGKTLRRFNARVEAGRLELSVAGLREKILSLFKLSQEVDLTLTYLDEDGDLVTLADDEDIHDVMRQSLNPLRITAKVKAENGNTSSVRYSENSTPIKSLPRASKPHLPNLNNTVFKVSNAVPEPIREVLSKLYLDSKVATSSPQLPERILHFSKLLQNYMITASDSQIGIVSSSQSAGSESAKLSSMANEPEASGGGGANPKVVTVPNSVNEPIRCEKKMETVTPLTPVPECYFINPNANHCNEGKEEVKKFNGNSVSAEAGKPAWENIKAVASSVLGNADKEVKKLTEVCNSIGKDSSSISPFTFPYQSGASKIVNFGRQTIGDMRVTAEPANQNFAGKYPYSGMSVANEAVVPYTHFGPRLHPFKRSYSQGGAAGVFHRGVRCNGCGVHPITGPRFKSKVKDDFDLCSLCFAEMGSEADYTRLDRPIPYRHPHPCKTLYGFNPQVNTPPTLPQSLRGMRKPNRPKLDSRFITDVNVIDGTMMAPLTSFTKIWRMRNNGTLVWPQGTQLVWIGGDRLSDSLSAGLQIPLEGLVVENELEVAVDFVAPELPGRYVSYWRMASPAGQKFGQRVWVLIQVDASGKDSALNNNRQGLNLNLPPESSGLDGAEAQAINVEPIVVDGRLPIPEPSNRVTLVEPLVDPFPTKDQDMHFPINNNLLVNGTPAPPEMGPASVSYPPIISTAVPYVLTSVPSPLTPVSPPRPLFGGKPVGPARVSFPPVSSSVLPSSRASPPRPIITESSALANVEEDDVEEILLKELEEMGFKEVDLNKEILRSNEYNLEKSVDDLCGVCEWDPILEELQEMGFRDNVVNKKLLKKNNGSIKGVVMDLITGERSSSSRHYSSDGVS